LSRMWSMPRTTAHFGDAPCSLFLFPPAMAVGYLCLMERRACWPGLYSTNKLGVKGIIVLAACLSRVCLPQRALPRDQIDGAWNRNRITQSRDKGTPCSAFLASFQCWMEMCASMAGSTTWSRLDKYWI
jgi:hypothetical protein